MPGMQRINVRLVWMAVCTFVLTLTPITRADDAAQTADASPAPSSAPEAVPAKTPAADSNGVAAPKTDPVPREMRPRRYVDEDYDVEVSAPLGWYRVNPKDYSAAGEILRVWNPGSTTAILIYRFVPTEPLIPLNLVDVTAENASTNLNAEILEQGVRTVAGKRASWLVYVGPGTGGAINGHGNIRTAQHLVAIPRENDAIVLMLATPEEDFEKYESVFKQLVASLKVGGKQTPAQAAGD